MISGYNTEPVLPPSSDTNPIIPFYSKMLFEPQMHRIYAHALSLVFPVYSSDPTRKRWERGWAGKGGEGRGRAGKGGEGKDGTERRICRIQNSPNSVSIFL